MKDKKAVILLSGGIDSATTLLLAKSEGYELFTLSFDYNQRHKRELESAQMIASTIGVKKHLIIHFDLREIGGSALTSEVEVPSFKFHPSSFIPVTYVPARNTIFLSFALAWAEVLEVESIFIGANAVDYSGYPDCRPEYIKAFEDMANLATKASVLGKLKFSIIAPLINLKKSEIIKTGIKLGLNYALTWSCYDPQPAIAGVQGSRFKVQINKENKTKLKTQKLKLIPCGRCDSCVLRARGFKEAGIEDPLIIE
ncbi:MAG: 7-cyano-7-deazaguanine synthase QueC [Nitrospirae bacterium]|nr:7-cyano-7-deazaguanine synthase QueC [Nitrospirota bacterium]